LDDVSSESVGLIVRPAGLRGGIDDDDEGVRRNDEWSERRWWMQKGLIWVDVRRQGANRSGLAARFEALSFTSLLELSPTEIKLIGAREDFDAALQKRNESRQVSRSREAAQVFLEASIRAVFVAKEARLKEMPLTPRTSEMEGRALPSGDRARCFFHSCQKPSNQVVSNERFHHKYNVPYLRWSTSAGARPGYQEEKAAERSRTGSRREPIAPVRKKIDAKGGRMSECHSLKVKIQPEVAV
jgi:hypothetical protein